MSLSTRIEQVRAIADALWLLPPPARREVADKLFGLGIRMHPDLATLEIERDGPAAMGNHRPSRPVSKKSSTAETMDMLRSVQPEMVAKIEAAHKRDDVLERMAAIKPKIGEDKAADAQRAALARELGIDVPDDVFAAVDDLRAQVDAFADEETAKGDAERAARAAEESD